MTDLNTAKINSLTQDVQLLRVRLGGLTERIKELEDAENHRQQDEDAERALGRPAQMPVQVPVQVKSLVDRVAFAITKDSDGPVNWRGEASDAIYEVARWLKEQGGLLAEGWARHLEQESERG